MKIDKHTRTAVRAGFTLIELLVVIAIIAILAGTAVPAFNNALLSGKQTRAASDARQIGLAIKMYASDNDGSFPSTASEPGKSIKTSNDAFRTLVPTYVDTETIFTVAGSKAGAKADNRMDTPSQVLSRGENHWAYVSGLSSSSNSNYPLIVDHTDGSGYYTNKEGDFGGTWKGGKAIVVRTDASASAVRLEGSPAKRYLPRYDDKGKNALLVREYMGDAIELLEPAR
jgi:prepilin-type N-terminal cleavage/methylation domain-containing protein